jgi:branched-chain amino acid transport system permease protein
MTMDAEWMATLTVAALYAMVAIATQLGLMSGGFSLAPVGWMGVGAYCAGMAATQWELPPVAGLGIGVALAAVLGPVVVAPVRRISGLYYALVSLAFVLVLQAVLGNLDYTGGALGIFGVPLTTTLGVAVTALLFACAVAFYLSSGDRGRVLRAAGQDPMVARSFGVNVYRLQLAVGSVSAVLSVVAGFFYAGYVGYVDPTHYGFALVVQILAMVIIGGRTNWVGSVLGALLISCLPLLLRPLADYRDVMNGALLIAVMVFLPGGLYSLGARVRAVLARGSGRPPAPVAAEDVPRSEVRQEPIGGRTR